MLSTIPKIHIVILNWNGKEDTCECIESVQKIKYLNHEIVVVDNGSSDNSVETFKQRYPQVKVLETGENLGYSGGNNIGIEYALDQDADFIFILNNDTVVDQHILKHFLEVSQQYPKSGILTAKIYYHSEPGKIWYAGSRWNPGGVHFSHEGIHCQDDNETWSQVKIVESVCGCALFMKSRVASEIGLFDDRFFLTWEETDFATRAIRAGFECYFVPSAIVWHKVSSSFEGGAKGLLYKYFWHRNRLLWIEKSKRWHERLRIYTRVVIREIVKAAKVCANPNSDCQYQRICWIQLIATRDYFLRRFGNISFDIRH